MKSFPASVRELADRNYALLKRDPRHPSLHARKSDVLVGPDRLRNRAFATEADGDMVWFWIGSHADYDALIR